MIQHLAIVMDGNRRWAKRQGLFPWYGHKEGVESLKRVVDFCLKQQIQYASFYAFSLENFKRSNDEKHYLFDLIVRESEKNIDLFIEKGARIRFIGDRSLFPANVVPACERLEQATAHLTTINLIFLFCYGARQEIVDSVKRLIKDAKEGRIDENDLSDELFARTLWTSGIPEPDLIIRTGGAQRLSNFLLYQAAYSELYFLNCLWPEITTDHLLEALGHFEQCKRNFGT